MGCGGIAAGSGWRGGAAHGVMDPGASAYGDHRLTTLASKRFAPTCCLTCGDLMKQQYASSNECTQCPTTMSFPLSHGSSTPAASMTLLCSWPRDASLLTCMVTPGKMSLPPKPRRVTVTSPSSSLSPSLPCCVFEPSPASSAFAAGCAGCCCSSCVSDAPPDAITS